MDKEAISRLTRFILVTSAVLLAAHTPAAAASLSVTARNDKPGPVDIRVEAFDDMGAQLLSSVLSWTADDNTFSAQNLTIPAASAVLRFTFINDAFTPGDPDLDRNAFIDFFSVDGRLREGESFDRTGGTDQQFPGCEAGTVDGRTVAVCGNNNDYVEYDIVSRFFKKPFPNYAPGGIPDFDQKQDRWAHEIVCGPDRRPTTSPLNDDQLLPFATDPADPALCLTVDTPIIDKGLDGIMDTVLNNLDPVAGDDFYRYEYCAPTSVANCLWWFDSKFERDPGAPPCDGADTYDLVTAYPASPDDHCDVNVDDPQTPAGGALQPDPTTAFGELVEDLAWRMDTGGQRTGNLRFGTNVNDMEAAVRTYLSERGLTDRFIVNLVRNPDFGFIDREVRRSQNVILALSFVQDCAGQLQFVGGHAVTTAGVDSDPADPALAQLCLSDPFFDLAELGSTGRVLPGPHPHPPVPPDPTHNDAAFVSHDCYPVNPFAGGPYGQITLASYANVVGEGGELDCPDIANFIGQNQWDPSDPAYQEASGCDSNCTLHSVVSYALEISPFFWKAGGFTDYAPSGMPDFDQRQDPAILTCPLNQSWSYCGPTAVANSFWWFDSKFEQTPVPPPAINDTYPLVRVLPHADDHDPANVLPLIDALGDIFNTDNRRALRPAPFCGTYIDDMEAGVNKWLANAALDKEFFVNVVRAPSFEFVAGEVEKSQDVILLLGFWQLQEDELGLPVWVRIGGHYVTVAGVDSEGRLIAFSDPFLDAAESGATGGRVLPSAGAHAGHPAAPPDTLHNDAELVSHDMYEAVPTGSPGGIWGPKDYAAVLGAAPGGIDNFFGQNSSDELDEENHPVRPPTGPNPVITEVDYALEVSPCPPDTDGDGFRPICDNDCDDTNPDIFPGAAETCDGVDNNCDGAIDEGFPNLGLICTAGIGECQRTGVYVCSADGTTTVCSAVPGTPVPELSLVCDGLDNDCDGQIDEDFPQDGVTKLTATPGAPPNVNDVILNWAGGQPNFFVYRSLSPQNVVDPANLLATIPAPPRTYLDPHVPGQPPPGGVFYYKVTSSCVLSCPEICDGADNDCDGAIDEPGAELSCNLPNATPTCLNGICQVGQCSAGWNDCDQSPGNGCEADLTSDQNNCGTCGNVCSFANAAPQCVSGACQMGPCVSGWADCDLNDANGCETNTASDVNNCGACFLQCNLANANPACITGVCLIGQCDPGFDDCDGSHGTGCEADLNNDPNNCSACGNVCVVPNATAACSAGACQVGQCNSGWGDCNQSAADGCETNVNTDPNNCGFCGNACAPPNSTASCNAGTCSAFTCNVNWWDIDGDPVNGCEYNCNLIAGPDDPDPNFNDTNCDGVDGDITKAVFVSQLTGSDANPGTQQLPVQSTTKALSLATAGVRDQILVATGSYADPLILKDGVGIYGNYSLDFRSRTASLGPTGPTFIHVGSITAVTANNLTSPTVLEFLSIRSSSNTLPGGSTYGIRGMNSPGLWVRHCWVQSINGGPGVNGSSPPGTAPSGGPGQPGQPGCEDSTDLICEQCTRPQGGPGGGSACGRTGGRGGSAGRGGSSGFTGQTGIGGTPGGPGTPPGNNNWNTPPTYWGFNGASGAPGFNGPPGAPAYIPGGYVPADGQPGGSGSHAAAGGGGGGGGGGTNFCFSYGGGGGGGGAGGCGGTGAGGGTSGGGSFAIYLWGSPATIENCVLQTGSGGNGGAGGVGQPGGSGGAGGRSSDPTRQGAGNDYGGSGEQDDGSNGGRGGDGGIGGQGGHGGGGAGGPSIGILTGGLAGPPGPIIGNTFLLGPPGSGGPSAGNPGPPGVLQGVLIPAAGD